MHRPRRDYSHSLQLSNIFILDTWYVFGYLLLGFTLLVYFMADFVFYYSLCDLGYFLFIRRCHHSVWGNRYFDISKSIPWKSGHSEWSQFKKHAKDFKYQSHVAG